MLHIRVKQDPEKAARLLEQFDEVKAVTIVKEMIIATLKKDVSTTANSRPACSRPASRSPSSARKT